MRRILLIALCITILATLLSISSSAEKNEIESNEIEFIFQDDSKLSKEQQNMIIDCILNNETNNGAKNIICSLFGHKNKTEYVDAIRHKVYVRRPRCVEETYEVIICERCEHTEATFLGQALIDCCPED